MAFVPPTPNLQAFEAVARRRSFALAAAELHLTASAISHQVARLESQLGRPPVRTQRAWRACEPRRREISSAGRRRARGDRHGDRRPAAGRQQQPVRTFGAEHREPVADAAAARVRAGVPRDFAEPVGGAHAQRLRARPGRHRHPLRRAAVARSGGRAAVRGAHRAAGEPGFHSRAPAEASGSVARPCR